MFLGGETLAKGEGFVKDKREAAIGSFLVLRVELVVIMDSLQWIG